MRERYRRHGRRLRASLWCLLWPNEMRFVLVLFILALVLRAWGVWFGLPSTYHMDERGVIERALYFGTGDLNPHHASRPAHFHMYVLFFLDGVLYLAGAVLGRFSSPSDFATQFWLNPGPVYVVGRMYSAILGSLTVVTAYFTAKPLLGRRWAGFGALLLAVNLAHVAHSHFGVPAAAETFFVAVCVLFCGRIVTQGSSRHYALAGIAAGLAAAERYSAGLAMAAVLAAHVVAERNRGYPLLRRLFHKRVLLSLLCAGLAFSVTSPYVLLDMRNTWFQVMADVETILQPGVRAGVVGAPIRHALGVLLPEGMGWPALVLSFLGMAQAIWTRDRRLAVLLAFPVLYFLAVVPRNWDLFPRYIIVLYPFLAISAASAARSLTRTVRGRKVWTWLLVASLWAVAAWSALRAVAFDVWISREDTRSIAKRWVEAHVPIGKTIFVGNFHYSPQFETYLDFATFKAHNNVQMWDNPYDAHEDWKARILESLRERTPIESEQRVAYYLDQPLNPLDYLAQNEAEYVVTSGFDYERYFSPTAYSLQLGADARRIYDTISQCSTLAFQARPQPVLGFRFDALHENYSHPVISVYVLDRTGWPCLATGKVARVE